MNKAFIWPARPQRSPRSLLRKLTPIPTRSPSNPQANEREVAACAAVRAMDGFAMRCPDAGAIAQFHQEISDGAQSHVIVQDAPRLINA